MTTILRAVILRVCDGPRAYLTCIGIVRRPVAFMRGELGAQERGKTLGHN